ncbi:MAG: efflux RND transporter permease subunit, partial [Planctomycetota bacterium JB042]
MSLAGFAVRYRVIVTAGVAILMLWGALSYVTMPRREDPEYIVRTCQVLTTWPGTPTEEVEELITAPIEEEVNQLDGIRWVRSETTVGRSAVFVELDRATVGEDVAQMWDKVRSRVDRVQMPEPGIVPLVIDDFGDTNIMLLAVYQRPLPGEKEIRPEDRYTSRELEIFADRLGDDVKLVPGVAKVDKVGVRKEAIYIETDLGNWSQLSLTTSQLEALVARRNVIAPGGTVDTDVGRFSVKPTGELDAVSEIERIAVGAIGHGDARAPVSLADLGLRVVRAYEDPPSDLARFGAPGVSRECVIVAFTMKAGANIVEVCAGAREVIHRLTEVDRVLPPDLGVTPVTDQSVMVERKIGDFVWNVVGAIAIVVAVVFLMVGLRSATVMAANIPLVIVGSIAIITLFGVQLEQISLAAMIIALGMLVDNAVQITDQTRRLMSEGLPPFEAARRGADQLAFPILIATGTTIAAFYPMLIGLKGSTKEYVYSLPVTLTVTLGLSYVLAMTFCVLLAAWLVKVPDDPNASQSPVVKLFAGVLRLARRGRPAPPKPDGPGGFAAVYAGMVRICIKARFPVIAVSIVLLVAATRLPVRSEFFPKDIRDQFTIDVWLPEGASLEQTDRAARTVEDLLRTLSPIVDEDGREVERLDSMVTVVGKGCARWYLGRNPEPPRTNFAEVVVRTTEGRFTPGFVEELTRITLEGDPERGIDPISDARVIPRELMMGPVVDAPIGIRIYGPRLGAGFADPVVMRAQAAALKQLLRDAHGTWDVHDTWGSPAYQLRVEVDEDRANLAGVTNLSIAETLNAYFSGYLLTTFKEADHVVPVYLRLPPDERGSLDGLSAAFVEGANGKVPLDSVASLEARYDPARIDRRFLQRVIEVRARNEGGTSANDVVTALLASPGFAAWEAALPP